MNKLLLALLLVSGVVSAQETPIPDSAWTTTDIVMESITVTELVIDRNQTIHIADHPNEHETNLILGQHPSNTKINTYFGATIVGQAVVANMLSSNNRKFFLGSVITLETIVIQRNHVQFGLSAKF